MTCVSPFSSCFSFFSHLLRLLSWTRENRADAIPIIALTVLVIAFTVMFSLGVAWLARAIMGAAATSTPA